jgi:hypothetical protein
MKYHYLCFLRFTLPFSVRVDLFGISLKYKTITLFTSENCHIPSQEILTVVITVIVTVILVIFSASETLSANYANSSVIAF